MKCANRVRHDVVVVLVQNQPLFAYPRGQRGRRQKQKPQMPFCWHLISSDEWLLLLERVQNNEILWTGAIMAFG